MQRWKTTDHGASDSKTASSSPTGFAKTSNGAGDYVVVVTSPSGAAQSFDLTLAK